MNRSPFDTSAPPVDDLPETFAETALKLGGKSDVEARKTGAIDRADDQVEALYAPRYQTAGSPVHRAVWDDPLPIELFMAQTPESCPQVDQVMRVRIDVIDQRKCIIGIIGHQ